MYLYHSVVDYNMIKKDITTTLELSIDMDVFRNDFNGKYILSSVAIANSETLDLVLINRYEQERSIYSIYLLKFRISES